MFETLIDLPLFKGVSRERMSQAVGSHKFHFLKYTPGQTIFHAGDTCVNLAFIISGSVRVRMENPDHRFMVEQTLSAPEVIAPEFLFGRVTRYPADVHSIDTVSLLLVSKADYLHMLATDSVFMLNYLNLLAMNAQKAVEGIMAVSTGDLPERIAFWISTLSRPQATDIELRCSRRDLVSLFGVPRASLKQALEQMKTSGLIDYTAESIKVLDRRGILALLHNHSEPTAN